MSFIAQPIGLKECSVLFWQRRVRIHDELFVNKKTLKVPTASIRSALIIWVWIYFSLNVQKIFPFTSGVITNRYVLPPFCYSVNGARNFISIALMRIFWFLVGVCTYLRALGFVYPNHKTCYIYKKRVHMCKTCKKNLQIKLAQSWEFMLLACHKKSYLICVEYTNFRNIT